MPTEFPVPESCPYCQVPHADFTDDHIFPQFLGGHRTIRVCKTCNSVFGHTFEAEVSRQIARLQVFISHFGLDLTLNPAVWLNALTIEDKQYDLRPGPEGTQYVLSKPIIYKDAGGKITGGKARSLREAKRIARGLIESGKAKKVEITLAESPVLDQVRLDLVGGFDESLFRFCTKLVASLAIAFNHQSLILESKISEYLHGKDELIARVAFCDISPLNQLRTPLAHTIYLEMGLTSFGVVLLFGFKRVFVPLPSSAIHGAVLATLDPLTGEESFREVEPIGPREIPVTIDRRTALAHMQNMLDNLSQDAILRGARNEPKLYVGDLELGVPLPSWWGSSTVRYMFPNYPPR